MAFRYNAELIGNVGSVEELKQVNGSDVLNFSVAVKDPRDKSDEPRWIRVGVWGNQATGLSKFLAKGHLVFVEGTSLRPTIYKDKVQETVNARDVQVLTSRSESGGSTSRSAPVVDDTDDDVPF